MRAPTLILTVFPAANYSDYQSVATIHVLKLRVSHHEGPRNIGVVTTHLDPSLNT